MSEQLTLDYDKPQQAMPAPDAKDLQISSYINPEGKPLANADALYDEVERLAAEGNSSKFEAAAEAYNDAAYLDAVHKGQGETYNEIVVPGIAAMRSEMEERLAERAKVDGVAAQAKADQEAASTSFTGRLSGKRFVKTPEGWVVAKDESLPPLETAKNELLEVAEGPVDDAKDDLMAYLDTRPYRDENGSLMDPQTNEKADINEYYNEKEDAHYDETLKATETKYENYRDMADAWAEAENANDQTKVEDIQDAIQERLIADVEAGKLTQDEAMQLIDSLHQHIDLQKVPNRDDLIRDISTMIGNLAEKKDEGTDDLEEVAPLTEEEIRAAEEAERVEKLAKFKEDADVTQLTPSIRKYKKGSPDTAVTDDATEDVQINRRTRLAHAISPIRHLNNLREKYAGMETRKRRGLLIGALAVGVVGGMLAYKYGFNLPGNDRPKGNLLGSRRGFPGSRIFDHSDTLAPGNGNGNGVRTVSEAAAIGMTPPTRTPESMGIDTTQYSWDVANQLSSGNEGTIMQGAIDKYNAAHGTNFALTPHNGSTWIMDGGRAISTPQMEELNKLMEATV